MTMVVARIELDIVEKYLLCLTTITNKSTKQGSLKAVSKKWQMMQRDGQNVM